MIGLLIFLFGSLYSFYAVIRHLRLETFIFDLGVYDQIIYLASRFQPLYSSVLEAHPWGDHFTPTLLLLAPLYWLWGNVIILLLFQAFFAVFGAYPIYLLACQKLKHRPLSLTIALAYLLFFGLQNALAFDFHPLVLATTLLAWLFYFYDQKKFKLFWPTWLLFLGLQENFFLLSAALGLFLILKYRDFKRGSFILISSLSIFLLLTQILIPRWNNAPFTYAPTHLKSLSPWEIVKLFFWPASKIEVLASTFLAFGFLPLFSPAYWLLLLEEFFQRFVGTPISTRWAVDFQYNVILAPIVALAAIEAIQNFFYPRLAIFLILLGVIIVQIWQTPALADLFEPKFYDIHRFSFFRQIVQFLPPTASIAVSNNLGSHLTHRQNLIFLTNCLADPTIWKIDMKRCFKLQPDYLLADLEPDGNWNKFYPDGRRDLIESYLDQVQAGGSYRLIKNIDTFYLLEKVK